MIYSKDFTDMNVLVWRITIHRFQLVKNEVLVSPYHNQYEVLEFLGKGTFGQVTLKTLFSKL